MEIAPPPASLPVLCSTARLARSLRLADAAVRLRKQEQHWRPLQAQTLAQWLDALFSQSMLSGEIPADRLPSQVLAPLQERLLWEQAITRVLADTPDSALFDSAGMATAAMEANRLLQEWQLALPHDAHTEETRQFLHWRDTFDALCQQHDVLAPSRLLELQITLLHRGACCLPPAIALAGFDRISPQEQRLLDVLAARGVAVEHWPLGLPQPAAASQVACDNVEAECRAVVAWASRQLAANPQARLAIVAPELATLRARLAAMLDDTLHPESMHPAHAESRRCYDFSLGEPLASRPLVATALAVLRMAVSRYRFPQCEAGALLRDMHWSAGVSEADARARLEARMRRKLPATIQLEQLLRLARKAQLEGWGATRLVVHLEAMQQLAAAWPERQPPSAWMRAFVTLLEAAGWPGERSLSSHEFQARRAWGETLTEFSRLDALLGKVKAGEALRRLSQLCQERIFQPESEFQPQLLVMGMLESAAVPLDAVWVMGMNDHQWPPPARPNALLPAEVQRRAGAPNSCGRVQAEFAQVIQRRLLHSAPQVVFSWSRKDGERELRPSPLLASMPFIEVQASAQTLAERLARTTQMQWLDDHLAPPVREGEKVRGGAGLLRAQALCPAWAYYQYRLGARALDEATDGLDGMERGSLLHAVLQAFWDGKHSTAVQAMSEAALEQAIADAVAQGVRQFSQTLDEPLPTHFVALEQLRLRSLLAAWIAFEKQRETFSVQECERRVRIEIAGIEVELALDRVDALADGRLVVLDYKTGNAISHKSWADDRIAEPQLPIYASLALADGEVAAVCFAKVRPDEQKFIGIAAESGLLPGVSGLEDARKLFPDDAFPQWASLLAHWRHSITAIAEEVRAGEAAVRFADGNDLAYCEVRPLLRLPERRLQFERGGGGQ